MPCPALARTPGPRTSRPGTSCSWLICFWLVPFALLGAGCSDDIAHFPSDPGLTWLYNVEVTTMDGRFEQRYPLQSVPAGEFQSERVFAHETLDGSGYLYAKRDDGVWRVARRRRGAEPVRPYARPDLVMPRRPSQQESWTGSTITQVLEITGPPQETLFQIRERVPMTYRIAERETTVTVPAGTYDGCIKVEGSGSVNADVGNYIGRLRIEVTTADWYAPGVGLVRAERVETTSADAIDYGRRIMELTQVLD